MKLGVGGFKMHLGILAILIISVIEFTEKPGTIRLAGFFKRNWTLFPFIFYLIINILFNTSFPGVPITLTYFILGLWVFYFLYNKQSFISDRAILLFQWVLIGTGLFQSVLFQVFGYQLAFFNAEHYAVDASFATRLRGFFLEPNWFSIILTFNSLLIFLRIGNTIIKYKGLIGLSFLTLLLNGSYGFIGVIILGYVARMFIDLPKISKRNLLVFILMFIVAGGLILSRNIYKSKLGNATDGQVVSINTGSRLLPAVRTILFMSEKTKEEQVFGLGLGSWPYIGIEENQLGYIGFANVNGGQLTVKPAQRDSAEFHVFLLELGYLGILLFLFDYIYNYWHYRRLNMIYSLASACMLAAFFVYPVFKFYMYLVPFYLIRTFAVKEDKPEI
ncbi:hypothetical protein [Carboxylicivirga sp. RSCT41]|uniref:hypothetical protein n=1 Tax=Carboxylicivirga agarovorans TaxID=3417570 RepID=UPI003D342CBE